MKRRSFLTLLTTLVSWPLVRLRAHAEAENGSFKSREVAFYALFRPPSSNEHWTTFHVDDVDRALSCHFYAVHFPAGCPLSDEQRRFVMTRIRR